jgi:cyclic pyranopterin phosphate synthase
MQNKKLLDQHNRELNYLRISITDRCNLQCMYCMPHNLSPKLLHKDIMRYESILRLVRLLVELGVTKVRVTGGEPLVRKGVYEFLANLTKIDGLSDVSITTNGLLLNDNIDKIKSAGINRMNISLDTLNREKFKKITGHDSFPHVWKGINNAALMEFDPVKLNMVVLEGINDDELVDMAKLTFSKPFHIRFIEYMPIGDQRLKNYKPILVDEIKKRISVLGELLPVENSIYDGPAQRFKIEGSMGEIGFISPVSHHFCGRCNRLRLTANGKLRTCLLSDHHVDLKSPIRLGYLDRDLIKIILEAVSQKPMQHTLSCDHPDIVKDQMFSIGG